MTSKFRKTRIIDPSVDWADLGEMTRFLPTFLRLLVLCIVHLWLVVVEAQDESCTPGEVCYCSRRLRLDNSSGIIVDHLGSGNYKQNMQCLFYLETDRPMSSVRLRFNRFDLECLWDYLYIFSGDSLHSTKIAAFTGDLLPPPKFTPIPMLDRNETNSTSDSDVDPILIPYQEPRDIVLESPGSSLLLYFFTDSGVHATGFNISYWLNYSCPEECMGRGNCSEEGVCECEKGWSGEQCQLPVCPNDCFTSTGQGDCVDGVCLCVPEYTGVDCSVSLSSPHWKALNYTTSGNLTSALLARAGHSHVVTSANQVLVFGGYRFPTVHVEEGGGGGGSGGSGSGDGGGGEEVKVVAGPQLLLYDVTSSQWEEVEIDENSPQPSPRYGHSAVLYNDTMHVFGGVLIPEERITNEHWVLHLPTLTWSPLTISPDNDDYDVIDNSTSNRNLTGVDVDSGVVVTTTNGKAVELPLRVRSHTAHVVSTVMVVLFGMTDLQTQLIYFVQEYNFESGEWSVPVQNGVRPSGRMGHSSVYHEETGLIFVYGGQLGRGDADELLVYDPLEHHWSKRERGPVGVYLHTASLLWGQLMLVFGGSGDNCFSDSLFIYNIACDEWVEADYLGLPGDAGRIGHVSFVDQTTSSLKVFGGFLGLPLADMFLLKTGDCDGYSSEEECRTNGTVFCGWSHATNSCVPLGDNPTSLPCSIDECLELSSCDDCMTEVNCTWIDGDKTCKSGTPDVNATCPASAVNSTTDMCEWFGHSCWGCVAAGCQWTGSECVDSSINVTTAECSVPCSYSTCSECAPKPNCIWCPSLNKCVDSTHNNSYAYNFPFGQCLGYSRSCRESCDSHKTCDDCHTDPECGWCRDPADTGLGTCSQGGFVSPLPSSSSSSSCPNSHWFFDQCPACQCNGHSTCVNGSVCEECQNNTQGDTCEQCADGYYGDATGGGICTECYCNDYPASCDKTTGSCLCYDVGVTGPSCSVCASNNSYEGDPNNFCYYEMSVGFVYTFEVSDPREKESFYLTVPPDDVSLTFKFELRHNPDNQLVVVQLFLGKVSEGLWVLANISGPIIVGGGGEFTRELDDRPGSRNATYPPLFSFAHPRIRNFSNFTDFFRGRRERDYTRNMWDGNVALVIRVSNLTNPMTFRITLDQTNLWFLLYFFATFIICFTGLLTAFMIGWYLKRKIELRRYMRQQYRDLRRRVARPFSRIKIILHRRAGQKKTQHNTSSYVSYQPCKSGKAAILTSFIHLPGDSVDGRPAHGRTGLCLGTALVRLNDRSTKDRGSGGRGGRKGGKKRRGGAGEGEEMVGLQQQQQQQHSEGERNGSVGGPQRQERSTASTSASSRPTQ